MCYGCRSYEWEERGFHTGKLWLFRPVRAQKQEQDKPPGVKQVLTRQKRTPQSQRFLANFRLSTTRCSPISRLIDLPQPIKAREKLCEYLGCHVTDSVTLTGVTHHHVNIGSSPHFIRWSKKGRVSFLKNTPFSQRRIKGLWIGLRLQFAHTFPSSSVRGLQEAGKTSGFCHHSPSHTFWIIFGILQHCHITNPTPPYSFWRACARVTEGYYVTSCNILPPSPY